MKIVSTILVVIIGLVVLFLIAAAILPKEFKLKVETTISKPQTVVWDYVKLIKNQENYSVRVMADPAINMVYSGTDGEVGFVSSRSSEMQNVGVGAQEIIAIDEGNSYQVEVRFEKPMKATNLATTTLTKISDTDTKVINTFEGVSPFPFNVFTYFFLGSVEKDMQMNLDNLKVIVEKL